MAGTAAEEREQCKGVVAMSVPVHPTSSRPTLATARTTPRWSTSHWVLVGVLSAALAALAVAWVRVVPALLADWQALTPFETSIAWLVTGVLSALTIAAACLTAAAALWQPSDSTGGQRT